MTLAIRTASRRVAALWLVLACAALVLLPAAARAASFEKLTVVTKAGPLGIDIEMAVTPAERSKGLMYRAELAPNTGMLFDFGFEQPVTMWMKNTYIPLDMLFIRADGRVASIATDTVPLSTATISSGVPVKAVLELPAGTVRARGIAVGDRVEHRLFGGG
ncbi:DUF192 domain-containing protein [Ancylobacter dichloromethanicus]|uniref:DUF192 domain-containing protein n=1 Tax=Ancylobacter dichloromethanicus TaxID=518825 RepID=A0A9W6J7E7_9HYPH|nr:DUF192 domain-containing protein [Ancylobacter dichloromethanicus]MBS7554606.1 DUF192 domain-containing protein [Ancylobacter dichloromethanicus]GLK71737.1 hypothetical protein GCM10017643_18520 [Ancylobacter dichloromethanicus]